MSDHDRVEVAGFVLPRPSSLVWATIFGSVIGYFVVGRAAANLIAVIGAILVTALLVAREKATRKPDPGADVFDRD